MRLFPEALEALHALPMEGLVSVGSTSRYQSGQVIQCQGCLAGLQRTRKVKPSVICGVPQGSSASARQIPSETAATPGWGTYRCYECKTWTEFEIHRAEVAA